MSYVGERFHVLVIYPVPGHIEIPGNRRTNELTTLDITIRQSKQFSILGVPLRSLGRIIGRQSQTPF